MEIWSAFIFGILGSFHCVGMCGPIVLALPTASSSRFKFFLSRLVYNLGRVVTYSIMGLIIGAIGQQFSLAGYQNVLSISMGIVILIMVLIPTGFFNKLFPFRIFTKVSNKLKSYWGILFKNSSTASMFLIGVLNGFLPCGFVYIALAGAASTGSMISGSLYMALFGLGTLPILLVLSFATGLITGKVKKTFTKVIPIGGVILALLIILRGMSLGIPYISPKIVINQAGQQTVDCCHPAEGK